MITEWRPVSALVLTSILLVCGCGEGPEPAARKSVAVTELPANVRDAAKKAIPGVEFENAWHNLDKQGKLESYEVRGRAGSGKIREVRVGLDGKILEAE